jgi:two-component system NtrC family sensor kinase
MTNEMLPQVRPWEGLNISQRILVVDDEAQIVTLIQRLLENSEYESDGAYDGPMALDLLRERAQTDMGGYALVLADLKMPGMDGLQLLQSVKEQYPDTMFVLITGFATVDSAVAALRQGAYDYLTKPLDMKHLLSAVQRALEHRALLLQNRRLVQFLQETAEALRQRTASLEVLHREEQHKTQRLRQVNAIARQITTILDVDTLVNTVLRLIGPAFDLLAPSFGLIQEDVLRFTGGALNGQVIKAADSIFWRLTAGGRQPFLRLPADAADHVAVASRSTDAGVNTSPAVAQPPSLTGDPVPSGAPYDLVFPLQAGDKTVGFWVADWQLGGQAGSRTSGCVEPVVGLGGAWHDNARFREQDLPYLEAVAAQTVAVLENARLYAVARQVDELAFLNRVSRAANQSLNLQQTIRSVLRCIQPILGASLVEICLLNDRQQIDQVFSLVRWQRENGGATPSVAYTQRDRHPLLGDEFVRRVGSQPLIVSEPSEAEQASAAHAGEQRSRGVGPFRSRLGVSLRFGEKRVGVLGVASPERAAYDVERGHLLQVVAGQVAAAIENALLFREVESGRRQLLESRNTLQTLFDGILEGIYIVDRDKRVLAINRTQATWAGQEVADLVGHPAAMAFPASQSSLTLIADTFAEGKPMSASEHLRSPDDQWTEWEIQTYPIASADAPGKPGVDQIDRVVVVVRDVTEQRWLEASLLQSEKLAAIGTLAAGVAHEINNPMTVISANAQILREEIPSDHAYYSSIQLIDRAAERASKVVRNLLDVSRSEEFELVPTDLNASLRDAISLVGPQFSKAQTEVIVDLAPDLPPVLASPDNLQVVWLNLLLNARDAIQESKAEGRVRAVSRRSGDWAVVEISDNGRGMPPEQLRHTFEPFFTTKQPGKGTGLGLFTCYRTVTRHHGEIKVDSQPGQGATFQVLLPIDPGVELEP